MAKVDINFAPLVNDVRSAWAATSETMGREFLAVITEPIHLWPRGENPRDIVNTGALRDSQVMVFVTPYVTEYQYPGIDYADDVMYGTAKMPGRNWGAIALARKPLLKVFEEAMGAYL
jgi:hypothetical protein